MELNRYFNKLILEAANIKISAKNKLKICQEIFKNTIVINNIKKFKLSNTVEDMCKSLKIHEVRQDGTSLIITVFPVDEKSSNGYLGNHTCTIECENDFSKFYNVSFDG
jgi:hypothetical protein